MPLHDAPLNFEGLCNHLDGHVIFHVMVCNNSCNYMNIPSCYIIYYTHRYTHHYIILHAIIYELLLHFATPPAGSPTVAHAMKAPAPSTGGLVKAADVCVSGPSRAGDGLPGGEYGGDGGQPGG